MKKYLITLSLSLIVSALAVGAFYAAPTVAKAKAKRSLQASDAGKALKKAQAKSQTQAMRAISAANPYTLPAEIVPTDADIARCLISDINNDGKTWKLDTFASQAILNYSYSSTNAADDWFFIPFTQTQADSHIKVSLMERTKTGSYPERFEVCIGDDATPLAMTRMGDVVETLANEFTPHNFEAVSPGQGLRWVGIHCVSEADKYELFIKAIKISAVANDSPSTPEILSHSIDGQAFTATVKIPSQNIAGGALTGTLSLRTFVDGEKQGADISVQAGAETPVTLTLEPGQRTVAFACVQTLSGSEYVSEQAALSFRVVGQKNYTIPFFMQPTQEEFEFECTTLNVGGDTGEWLYDSSRQCMYYHYTSLYDADDWVFLPAINFAGGGAFDFSMRAAARSSSYPEEFEVYMGDAPTVEAMTQTVIARTSIDSEDFLTFTSKIIVPGGKKVIGIHCVSPKDHYDLYVKEIRVNGASSATPAAPEIVSADFNGTDGTLTLRLPATDISGATLTSQVGTLIYLDDEKIAETEPATAGSQIEKQLRLPLGIHVLKVEAYVQDGDQRLISPATVQTITVANPEGFAYDLPFHMQPTSNEAQILTILNCNEDENLWEYFAIEEAMRLHWNDNMEADDWIILPAVNCPDASGIYTFSMEARAGYSRFYEKFEVRMGTSPTPEAMTTAVVDTVETNLETFQPYMGEFTVPEAGKYYVGIHGISRREASFLYVRNFNIQATGNSIYAPGAPTDVAVTADPTGALTATVSFTFPTETYSGAPLPAAEAIDVEVTSPTGTVKKTSGLPGSAGSVVIDAKQDWNTFTLAASSPGKGAGLSAEAMAWVGLDTPLPPQPQSRVSRDNLSLEISWEPVTQGTHGGPVVAEGVTYYAYTLSADQTELIELGATPGCQYTYTPTLPSQAEVIVGLLAKNSKGSSELTGVYGVVGQPYALPLADDYSDGRMDVLPLVPEIPSEIYTGQWYFDTPGALLDDAADYDGLALIANAEWGGGQRTRLALPKADTRGASNLMASFDVLVRERMPEFTLYANTYDDKMIPVGTFDTTGLQGWHTFTFLLPSSLCDQQWANLTLEGLFHHTQDYGVIRSWSLASVHDNDLSIDIIAPTDMTVGDPADIRLQVRNNSIAAVTPPLPTLIVKAGDKTWTLETSSPLLSALEPGMTREFTFPFTPHTDMLPEVELNASIASDDDDLTNNTATAYIHIGQGRKILVTDLKAESDGQNPPSYTLTWTEPEITSEETDDMEAYEVYDFSQNLGPWRNYDGDGKETWGFEGADYPGQADPKAFQVIDATMFRAHSGQQCLMAICPEDGSQSNDWLISEEVEPGSLLSFWWNILTSRYGAETLEIMVSTTTREPSAFTTFKTLTKGQEGWIESQVQLPEDAKYFALRYVSTDIFGILLDDITYTPAGGVELHHYNLYVDGTKTDHSIGLSTTTIHSPADTEKHAYNLSVSVSRKGNLEEHPHSNTAYTSPVNSLLSLANASMVSGGHGVITLRSLQGQAVTICDMQGLQIAALTPTEAIYTLRVAPGIYTVSLPGSTIKVIVR